MSSTRRLLVVAHDAGRGAEQLFLVRLVTALRAQEGVDVEVLLWEGGPLLDELRAVGPVRVVDDLNRWWVARILGLVGLRSVGARLKGLRLRAWMLRAARRFPQVLAHGAASGRPFSYVVRPLPLVTHLSGDGSAWTDGVAEEDWQALVRASRGFVVDRPAAADRLAAEHGVDAAAVRVQESVVPAALPRTPTLPRRAAMGIPEGAVVVGATGTEEWWTAPEPIVPVAWELRRRRPDLDLHVIWTCYDGDPDGLWPLRHDIANAGLEDRFHIVAAPSALEHLELADLIVLTTRPETFRLVSLEVGLAAKPVVCFENGVTEAVMGDAAVAVPYLDLDALVDAAIALLDDPAAAQDLGRKAVARAGRAQEAAVDAPRWLLDVLDELLA